MTVVATLQALAAGQPLADTLLGACRLERGGVDCFGSEAIAHAMRHAPIVDLDGATTLANSSAAVLATRDEAIFADVYDGRFGRLWRVGQQAPGDAEPAIAVAFDTDLHQHRADVSVAAADHPALTDAATDRVRAVGRAMLDDPDHAAYRARAFAIRAFGDPASGAVLFAIHALAMPPQRLPSLTHAVAIWHGDAVRIVRDRAMPRDLRVRIAG